MGSRLFSNTTNLLGGHDFTNPEHRDKVARDPRTSPSSASPTRRSWAYDQIIEGIRDGKIKGLWVIATNPAHSWIDQSDFRELARAGSTSSSCRTCTTRPRRRARPTSCCPPPAGARRRGRSSTPSGGSACIKKVRRAPGPGAVRLQHLQARRPLLGLRRDVRRVGLARGGLPDPQAALGRPALRHHRDRRLPRCSTSRRHPVALPARTRADLAAAAPAVRRRPVLPPRRPGAVPLREPAADARAARRRVSPAPADRPRQRLAVAHADADGEVGRAPQALPEATCTSRSTPTTPRAWGSSPASGWSSSRGAAGSGPGPSSRRPCRAGRSSCRCTTRRPTA